MMRGRRPGLLPVLGPTVSGPEPALANLREELLEQRVLA